mmetsp:Transcript_20341/g.22661  ORF Transcript_20341/g.22661 Transcript_20341/m.22661 type:complete len:84 (-) Transcript_20341:174-425(-)
MSFTITDNLLTNIREIHDYNDTDCIMISNPSVNNTNVTKRITYDMDNNNDDEDDNNSICEFVKPRTPWYGSAFVHWLVFDVIG